MKITLNILITFLLLNLFLACKTDKKESEKIQVKSEITKSDTLEIKEDSEKTVVYSIQVEKIDSLEYYTVKKKTKQFIKNRMKITDFKEAKKLLNGIVEFDEQYIDYPIVKKIKFKNGKKPKGKLEYELDDCTFKAYYPEENILLCEGGHTVDISYNLQNGKQTEESGNPDLFVFHQKENFRLNGYFGGQECYSYFIQKKIKGEYEKVIQLEEEFEKLTKHWLCTIGESFWATENTLYLTETDYEENGIRIHYFKIKLIEK